MWFELYLMVGTAFAVLSLYAKKKLGEEIEGKDLLLAIVTIFVWLPFLIYYAVQLYRDYKRMQEDYEAWQRIIERAVEKAFEEIEQAGDENGESTEETE